MATWKSENSMLTQTGVEILNKLNAGLYGKATITRVVAGSGRVNDSALYTQTNISGELKEMEITRKTVHDTGFEITLFLSNDDFAESFNLNQIGIFVTHPDYSGEVLYHISQCDAGDFDTIPPANENPVTMSYSLYLEHGNSDNIELIVNPQGVIGAEDLEALTKDLVPYNLVMADENNKLADSGISALSLGTMSKNMLHNWYLQVPVDTKNGYIAEKGVVYYSDSTLSEWVANLTEPVPATRVGDDNFYSIVLNGTTYYVDVQTVKRGYASHSTNSCLDRWILNKGDGGAISQLLLDTAFFDGITLTLGSKNGKFFQNLSGVIIPNMYRNRFYTLSVKVKSLSGGSPVLYCQAGTSLFEVPITATGVTSLPFELTNYYLD